ncbi:hypothetical protein NQ315_013463 [Exocentrus adspersus]|uniref:Gag protein n=1 Tax=Exocentrus adspersus TaxID=1586481 RepID=A0AAV8VEG5_9CUCU|nr:hypothetical protein NQ315_013463 [Exocentrus adspersus]
MEDQRPAQQRLVDTNLLKLYIDTIPLFDGNNLVLKSYIDSVRNTFSNFPNDQHNVTHSLILQAVKNKLRGRAQSLVASRTDLQTWTDIETLLKLTFGDQRDLQYLTHQLTQTRPHRNERPYDFGLRLQELRAVILMKINEDEQNADIRNLQINNYNNIVKTIFITNLPPNIQTIIRLKNPDTLESALNYVLEEEEFQNFSRLYHTNSNVSKPQPQNFKPIFHNTQNTQKPIPNQNQNFNQNFKYPNLNQQFRNNNPQFPSQPINVQPRPIIQKFPTNQQVFGKPNNQQNVWKQKPANLSKPTPMSGISHQSKPKPTNQMYNTEAHSETPHATEDYYQTVEDREEIDARLSYYHAMTSDDYYVDFPDEDPETDQEQPEDQNFTVTEPTQFPT